MRVSTAMAAWRSISLFINSMAGNVMHTTLFGIIDIHPQANRDKKMGNAFQYSLRWVIFASACNLVRTMAALAISRMPLVRLDHTNCEPQMTGCPSHRWVRSMGAFHSPPNASWLIAFRYARTLASITSVLAPRADAERPRHSITTWASPRAALPAVAALSR